MEETAYTKAGLDPTAVYENYAIRICIWSAGDKHGKGTFATHAAQSMSKLVTRGVLTTLVLGIIAHHTRHHIRRRHALTQGNIGIGRGLMVAPKPMAIQRR